MCLARRSRSWKRLSLVISESEYYTSAGASYHGGNLQVGSFSTSTLQVYFALNFQPTVLSPIFFFVLASCSLQYPSAKDQPEPPRVGTRFVKSDMTSLYTRYHDLEAPTYHLKGRFT